MTEVSWSYEDIAEVAYESYQATTGVKVGFYDLSNLERKAWITAIRTAIKSYVTLEHDMTVRRLYGDDHGDL